MAYISVEEKRRRTEFMRVFIPIYTRLQESFKRQSLRGLESRVMEYDFFFYKIHFAGGMEGGSFRVNVCNLFTFLAGN